MTENIARSKAQDECKEAARKSGYNCSIIATVGFGKTKIMIDLAEELIEAGLVNNILYLCDSRRLRDDTEGGFPAELNKWGSEKMKNMIRLECYQTACKWMNKKFDLVLADEVDFSITTVYIRALLNNQYKYKLLVSGTLTLEKKKILKEIAPIVYRFSTNDAEDAGVINKTEYYLYNYRLTKEESKSYNSMTKKIAALSRAGVDISDDQFVFWTRRRKQFLNTLDSSYIHCRRIMQFLWNKNNKNRVIIFCEQTSQANRCCKYSYHGGNEQDDNLRKFQAEEISAIATVSKVTRGMNLVNTNVGLFESMSGSSTRFEQRGGRIKRLAIDELATAIFMCPWYSSLNKEGELVWKPTVVQKWIEKGTENISNIEFKNLKI